LIIRQTGKEGERKEQIKVILPTYSLASSNGPPFAPFSDRGISEFPFVLLSSPPYGSEKWVVRK